MPARSTQTNVPWLFVVGILAWCIPGAGHLVINERRRAVIIFTTLLLTFVLGLYIGSIGVINPFVAKSWYVAQMMNSPLVALLGRVNQHGQYAVYGRPNEIGQIYTSITGLLNLLCIVNAVYMAHVKRTASA